MPGFSLPHLELPEKPPRWASQVQLPASSVPAGLTPPPSLPAVNGRPTARQLEARRIVLEALDDLFCRERRQREALCGREYARRQRMLWAQQSEALSLTMPAAHTSAPRQHAARLRQYARGVAAFRARGRVLHLEACSRAATEEAEASARRHLGEWSRLAQLDMARRAAQREAAAAEEIWRDLYATREWECAVAAKRPPRHAHPFAPALQWRPQRVDSPIAAAAEGRLCAVLWGKVHIAEGIARRSLVALEALRRTACEWEMGAAQRTRFDEPAAREAIVALRAWGACGARLSAVLRLQWWWRMRRARGWLARRRVALQSDMARRRAAMTARDYRTRLERLKRKGAPRTSAGTDEVDEAPIKRAEEEEEEERERGGVTRRETAVHGGGKAKRGSLESMAESLEAAALMSHQCLFDYFVFTLMCRASDMQEIAAARLGPPAALLRLPHRLYVRRAAPPFARWREGRWLEGSVQHARRCAAFGEMESRDRAALAQLEAREAEDFAVWAMALRAGPAAVRSLAATLMLCAADEDACRRLLGAAEAEERALWRLSLPPAPRAEERRVEAEEHTARAHLLAAEAEARALQCDGAWRWSNLAAARERLRRACGSSRLWSIARANGATRRCDSLHSAALVVTRFMRCVARQRRLRRGWRRASARLWQPKSAGLWSEADWRRVGMRQTAILDVVLREETREGVRAACGAFGATPSLGVNRTPNDVPDAQTTETAAAARALDDTAAAYFAAWFDSHAADPALWDYRVIIARFMAAEGPLLARMRHLFAEAQKARGATARMEETTRRQLYSQPVPMQWATAALLRRESRAREALWADVQNDTDALSDRAALLHALARATLVAAPANPRAKPAQRARGALGTAVSPCMRLSLREDIVRTSIALGERRAQMELLLHCHIAFAERLESAERAARTAACVDFDQKAPHIALPIAQKALLTLNEADARAKLETQATLSRWSPIFRGCAMYATQTLTKHALRLRVALADEARHFDRTLTDLLLRRVAHVGSKVTELIAAETCARSRIESIEEAKRTLILGEEYI